MTALEQTIREIVREEIRAALGAPQPEPAGLLTVEAAAVRVSMSRSYIRAAIRDGRLPAVSIGRAVRVKASDLDRLSTRRRTTPGAETVAAQAARILRGAGGGK